MKYQIQCKAVYVTKIVGVFDFVCMALKTRSESKIHEGIFNLIVWVQMILSVYFFLPVSAPKNFVAQLGKMKNQLERTSEMKIFSRIASNVKCEKRRNWRFYSHYYFT